VYFIDWLKVTQTHSGGGLPLIGDELITTIDLETGERLRESPNMKKLEGSYSSKLSIRCDGFNVTVDGNPSRWQRLDNLFGLRTFDEAIGVYNCILDEHGLPPFTKNTSLEWVQGKDGKRATRAGDGSRFLRVDWTRNLSVGQGNVPAFLRAIASQSIGRGKIPQLYQNGHTVDWARGSSYWYQKLYNKAVELREHLKKTKKKQLSREEIAYLEKLINYCEEIGLAREEKEFKRAFLERKNLCFYGITAESDFEKYLDSIEMIIRRLEMATWDYETIADQLLEKKIVTSRQAANATQGYAMAWLHGQHLKETMGRSQYFTHRKRLLELGIDVSSPCEVTRLPQIKHQREINVSTALPPSWYRMPPKTPLKLVA